MSPLGECKMRTSPVLLVIALAAVSLLALNFSGAATNTTTAPARHYYLTKANFNGSQPLTACAAGYHFASFAEILDPAMLTYNKTLGRSAADDGAGPPTVAYGWARSGYASNAEWNGVTTANCSLWTSASSSDYGDVGALIPPYPSNAINSGSVTYVPGGRVRRRYMRRK
jgi:hypothetical protein